LRKGVDTLKAVLDGLKADEEWSDAVIEPYEWIGVENVSKSSYILRAIVRTAPARQFELRREINMRVVEAFAKEQVPLGVEAAPALISPLTQSPNPT
jgi:small conductance mechanosensitive channel